jgi:DNA-binding response OmpR family regulator
MSTTVLLDDSGGVLAEQLREQGFEIAGPGAPADVVLVFPPFDHDELVERIRAAAGLRAETRVTVGPLTIDATARLVTVNGVPVKLSQKEFELLAHLASDPERVYTRAELLRDVWNWPPRMHTRTLDSHASRLRRKLRAVDPETPFVDNEWGVGYRLIGVYGDTLLE